jgi:hypothetical protein
MGRKTQGQLARAKSLKNARQKRLSELGRSGTSPERFTGSGLGPDCLQSPDPVLTLKLVPMISDLSQKSPGQVVTSAQ